MAKKLTTIEVYTGGVWQSAGTDGPYIDQLHNRPEINERLGEVAELTLTFQTGAEAITSGAIDRFSELRFTYDDGSVRHWRVRGREREFSGQRRPVIKAEGIESDLMVSVAYQTLQSSGRVVTSISFLNRPVSDVIAALLSANYNAPAGFVVGTIDAAVASKTVAISGNAANHLWFINEVCRDAGAEWEVVTNPATGNHEVNIYAKGELGGGTGQANSRVIDTQTQGNRITMRHRGDTRQTATRLIPLAGEGESTVTIGQAFFRILSATYNGTSGQTTVTLARSLPIPVYEMGAVYFGNNSDGFYTVIGQGGDTVLLDGDGSALDPGAGLNEGRFAEATGAEIPYVDDRLGLAEAGAIAKVYRRTDISPFPNLIARQGASADFSDYDGAAPVGMNAKGNPTLSEYTGDKVQFGTSALRVQTSSAGDGVTIPLSVDSGDGDYFSIWLGLWVETGEVKLYVEDTNGNVQPASGLAHTTSAVSTGLQISGLELPDGAVTIYIEARTDTADFYLDAITLVGSATAYSYGPYMGPTDLFMEACRWLRDNGGLDTGSYEGECFDPYTVGGNEIEIGSWVTVKDAYDPASDSQSVDIILRVVELRYSEDQLDGRPRKTVVLARKNNALNQYFGQTFVEKSSAQNKPQVSKATPVPILNSASGFAKTLDYIPPGAITSIALDRTLDQAVVSAGQEINIYDSITGKIHEDIIISTDQQVGDSSLAVQSYTVPAGGISAGSSIILPDATVGAGIMQGPNRIGLYAKSQALAVLQANYDNQLVTSLQVYGPFVRLRKGVSLDVVTADRRIPVTLTADVDAHAGSLPVEEERVTAAVGDSVLGNKPYEFSAYHIVQPQEIQSEVTGQLQGDSIGILATAILQGSTVTSIPVLNYSVDGDVEIEDGQQLVLSAPSGGYQVFTADGDQTIGSGNYSVAVVSAAADIFFPIGKCFLKEPSWNATSRQTLTANQVATNVTAIGDNTTSITTISQRADAIGSRVVIASSTETTDGDGNPVYSLASIKLETGATQQSSVRISGDNINLNGSTSVDGTFIVGSGNIDPSGISVADLLDGDSYATKGYADQSEQDAVDTASGYTQSQITAMKEALATDMQFTDYAALASAYAAVGQTIIVGGFLRTELIQTSVINIGAFNDDGTYTTPTEAQGYATTAQTNAEDYADQVGLDAEAQAKDGVAVQLGYDSYAAMVQEAIAGNTIIIGGYLNTLLVEAQSITADMLGVTEFADIANAKIAGYTLYKLDSNRHALYAGGGSTYAGLYHDSQATDEKVFYAGATDYMGGNAKFYVKNDGTVYASNFTLSNDHFAIGANGITFNIPATYEDAKSIIWSDGTNNNVVVQAQSTITGDYLTLEANDFAKLRGGSDYIDLGDGSVSFPANSIFEIPGQIYPAGSGTGFTFNGNVTIDGDLTITGSYPGGGTSPRTDEEIQDVVAGFILGGTNITANYDDANNTLTLNNTYSYSHPDTSSVLNTTLGGATEVFNSLSFDTYGHVTAYGTKTLTRGNFGLATTDSPDFAGLSIGGAAVATQTWVNANADVPNADYADSAGSATSAASAANADTVDGEHASAFANASHTHTTSDITNFTEATQDVVGALITGGNGVTVTYDDQGNSINITGTYSHPDTSSQANIDTAGADIIDSVSVDTYGHVTAMATRTLTRSTFGLGTGDAPSFSGLYIGGLPVATQSWANGQFDDYGDWTLRNPGGDTSVSSGVIVEVTAGTGLTAGSGQGAINFAVDTTTIATKTWVNANADVPNADYADSAGSATSAASAANADTVDGEHASAFANASHTHTTADITNFTEATQDVVGALISGGSNIAVTYDDQGNSINITNTYSHPDTSTQGNVNTSGGTIIDSISLDGYGHVTDIASRVLTRGDIGLGSTDNPSFGTVFANINTGSVSHSGEITIESSTKITFKINGGGIIQCRSQFYHTGGKLGFFSNGPISQPSVSGSLGSTSANASSLWNLLTALDNLGLINNNVA